MPRVREEGTVALRWAAPPGNQLIVMMMLLMLLSAQIVQTTVREERSLFRTARWEQSPPRRGCGVYRRDLLFSDSLCRARKTWIDDWTLALENVKEAILFASRQVSFRKVTQPGVGVERLLVFLPGRRAANTWTALLLYVPLLSECITAGSTEKAARARECLRQTKSETSISVRWVGEKFIW